MLMRTRLIYLIVCVLFYSSYMEASSGLSDFQRSSDIVTLQNSKELEETLHLGRKSFFYAIVGGPLIPIGAGGGWRHVSNTHFSIDISTIVPIYPIFSDISCRALYYPAGKGGYIGVGAGISPGWIMIGAMSNDSGRMSDPVNMLLIFGRFSIGYEWARKDNSRPIFLQLIGPLPTLSMGFGF